MTWGVFRYLVYEVVIFISYILGFALTHVIHVTPVDMVHIVPSDQFATCDKFTTSLYVSTCVTVGLLLFWVFYVLFVYAVCYCTCDIFTTCHSLPSKYNRF